jgi:hypothetical protein
MVGVCSCKTGSSDILMIWVGDEIEAAICFAGKERDLVEYGMFVACYTGL